MDQNIVSFSAEGGSQLLKCVDTPYALASAKTGECVVLTRDIVARNNRRKPAPDTVRFSPEATT